LVLTKRRQGDAEEASGAQRLGVVSAKNSNAAGQDVGVDLQGLLIVAERPDRDAE
jgi:hypothetical protein